MFVGSKPAFIVHTVASQEVLYSSCITYLNNQVTWEDKICHLARSLHLTYATHGYSCYSTVGSAKGKQVRCQ